MGKRPRGTAKHARPARSKGPGLWVGILVALGLALAILIWARSASTEAPPPSATPLPAPAPAAPPPKAPDRPEPPTPVTPPERPTASVPVEQRPTLPEPDGDDAEPDLASVDRPTPTTPPPPSPPPATPPPPGRSPSPPSPLKGRYAFAGLPKVKSGGELKLLENIGFAVGYSEERRDPVWVGYHLIEGPPQDGGRRPNRFQADPRTSARIGHEDYKQADYSRNPDAFDRGHMAPNHAIATFFGREAQLETFFMSNVCPQRKHLNQQTWEALEKTIADEWIHEFHELWVTVGPIFGAHPQRLNGKSEVPDAFYALVLVLDEAGKPHLLSVVMGQEVSGDLRLRSYVTTTDAVERATGLDFFAELPDPEERALESARAEDRWKLDQVRQPSRH